MSKWKDLKVSSPAASGAVNTFNGTMGEHRTSAERRAVCGPRSMPCRPGIGGASPTGAPWGARRGLVLLPAQPVLLVAAAGARSRATGRPGLLGLALPPGLWLRPAQPEALPLLSPAGDKASSSRPGPVAHGLLDKPVKLAP